MSEVSGRRAGLIVLIASFGGHAGNYLFYVIAARMVTPAEFAAISALIAFASICFMPVNGIQVAVARDVAVLRAAGRSAELAAYVRRLGRRLGIGGAVAVVVLGALSPLLSDRFHLGSRLPVVMTAVWVSLGAVLLIAIGVLQGLERFGYVAFSLAGPLGLLRPILLPLSVIVAGYAGGILAMIIAAIVGLVVLVPPALRVARGEPAEPPALPSTVMTMLALLAFSSLTNVDVLVAQAVLAETDRAHYAGAVLLGKIALFAPSALAMVLLPRATATLERGESADLTVLKTLALTAASGLGVAGVLWVMPTWVLTGTFGPAFAGSKPLLAPLALVMTGAAVLWVHLMFATAKRSHRMTYALIIAAVAHWGLLALLHDSAQQIILASAIVIGGTLLLIETSSGNGIVRMLLRHSKRAEQPLLDSPGGLLGSSSVG
jgi:O-antigen/teichoic acid export membrane protein